MNKTELQIILDNLGVPQFMYSLDGNLGSDKMILYQNYHRWEVFYFSEKGIRDSHRTFNSEHEACSYLLEVLKRENKNYQSNLRIRKFYKTDPPSEK